VSGNDFGELRKSTIEFFGETCISVDRGVAKPDLKLGVLRDQRINRIKHDQS